jgi:hypothetical protein
VRAGQTLALVESRDASQIAADRGAAAARVTLAARQLAVSEAAGAGCEPARRL